MLYTYYLIQEMRLSILALICVVAMAGCMPSPYYQKDYSVPQNEWTYNFKPVFKFDISDTTVSYNLMFIVRHTNAYPFSNIWLNVYHKQPGDSSFTRTRVEVPLAEPSGKWLGRGMGEISEQRMLLDQLHLNRPGKYEMRLEQDMRINELPEILQVGLRLEKIPRKKTN